MRRRQRKTYNDDDRFMTFLIAGLSGLLAVATVEDIYYFSTGIEFWSTGRFHPTSIFLGTLAFLCVLYVLLRLSNSDYALRYLEPYTPLLGASGVNLALKLNAIWLVPVAVVSIVWSVVQVRKLSVPRKQRTKPQG